MTELQNDLNDPNSAGQWQRKQQGKPGQEVFQISANWHFSGFNVCPFFQGTFSLQSNFFPFNLRSSWSCFWFTSACLDIFFLVWQFFIANPQHQQIHGGSCPLDWPFWRPGPPQPRRPLTLQPHLWIARHFRQHLR